MTNMDKFDELVKRVRDGISCEVNNCIGSMCSYCKYASCSDNYKEDIKRLVNLLVEAASEYGKYGFGKEEYKE